MISNKSLVAALAVGLWAQASLGAAWTATEGDLVINQTSLADFYNYYARNSTNQRLLEEPQGSIVQAGDVRRFGFLLGFEYGLTQRVTANLNLAYFYTQHLNVGDNVRTFTNSQPNTATGLQDLTGQIKYLLWQSQGLPVIIGVAPEVGFTIPVGKYDTSLNNPLGDGIVSVDGSLHLSLLLPPKLFINLQGLYRAREDKATRVGNVWPEDVVRANPSLSGVQTGAQIHDQIQGILEIGCFITEGLSIRGIAKRIDTLGGEDLTFEGMPQMMAMGVGPMPMFDNSLAYDQDALYVGGGPYWQATESFGIGVTYVQALWFRNFPNMKTAVLSLSYNPQFARKRLEREAAEARAAEEAAAAAEEAAEADEGATDPAKGTTEEPPANEAPPATEEAPR